MGTAGRADAGTAAPVDQAVGLELFDREPSAGTAPFGAVSPDQRIGRTVRLWRGRGVAGDHRKQRLGLCLAQLHTPLVERVDSPDRALGEHLMLVEGDQLA